MHCPGSSKWPAWASHPLEQPGHPCLGNFQVQIVSQEAKHYVLLTLHLPSSSCFTFISLVSPTSWLFAHNNSHFLPQARRIGTVRDVISLYQSGSLGYAMVTNDPQISAAYNKGLLLIHIICSLWVGLSSVPCLFYSRTQANGTNSLGNIKLGQRQMSHDKTQSHS